MVKSLFYDYLYEFVSENLKQYNLVQNFTPMRDPQLTVDYSISLPNQKPFFIYGINDNTKASKTVICCLNSQKQHIPFRSLIVHEDFNSLTQFNRAQITNAADKQYTSFDEFKSDGLAYIMREYDSVI